MHSTPRLSHTRTSLSLLWLPLLLPWTPAEMRLGLYRLANEGSHMRGQAAAVTSICFLSHRPLEVSGICLGTYNFSKPILIGAPVSGAPCMLGLLGFDGW